MNRALTLNSMPVMSSLRRLRPMRMPLMLLIWTCLAGVRPGFSRTPDLRFTHLTVQNGLSHNSITEMIQDSQGFLWFGTFAGLNRYDGYQIRVFQSDPLDSLSLSQNFIDAIFEDHEGYLWIGTENGLNRYDPVNETFTRFYHKPGDTASLSHNHVSAICEDKYGRLWVATWGGGLHQFNRKSGSFLRFPHIPGELNSPADNQIKNLYLDHRGDLWMATDKGLDRLIFKNPDSLTVRHYQHQPHHSNSISHNDITRIVEDVSGNLWIGTWGYGLNCLNSERTRFIRYTHEPGNPRSIGGNMIRSLCITSDGQLWVGTQQGMDLLHRETGHFTHYKADRSNPGSLNSNTIISMLEDRSGVFWIGSEYSGLNRTLYQKQSFTQNVLYNAMKALEKQPVTCIYVNEQVWFGTQHNGLYQYNHSSKALSHFPAVCFDQSVVNPVKDITGDADGNLWVDMGLGVFHLNPQTRAINRLNFMDHISTGSAIYLDSHHYLWIGLWKNGFCRIHLPDTTKHHFTSSSPNQQGFMGNTVGELLEDRHGNLWFGTVDKGLNFLAASDKFKEILTFQNWQYDKTDSTSISSNKILALHHDSRGMLWVGTSHGLNRITGFPDSVRFIRIDKQNGLPDNTIQSIQEDRNGFLWIATLRGLSKLNVESMTFINFNTEDGLYNHEFYNNAFKYTPDGNFLLGGPNGFNAFRPEKINPDSTTARMLITRFKIFNKEVPIGAVRHGRIVLPKAINYTREINLSYKDNSISFDFASMDFRSPGKTQYAYMMEGFDCSWIPSGNRPTAIYTNLPGGEYQFKVKGTNASGLWNDDITEITLRIHPPFWKTPRAMLLYLAGLLCIILLLRQLIIYREQLKNEIAIQKIAAEKQHEIDEMRLRFFTDISHEFKTPLTLISGLLEKMIRPGHAASMHDSKNYFITMLRNTRRLQRLINQMMDIRKLDARDMHVNFERRDIIHFIKSIFSTFKHDAAEKQIDYTLQSSHDHLMAWFDPDIVDKILYNLISNALKFTRHGGTVLLTIAIDAIEPQHQSRQDNALLIIKVKDSGIGIPKDKLKKIFRRFYQATPQHTQSGVKGTGIGLALTQELIHLAKGSLDVQSTEGSGSSFTVKLPISMPAGNTQFNVKTEAAEESNAFTDPSLLIIDDDADFLQYLKDELSGQYKIRVAVDGIKGLQMIEQSLPHLIISDVKMPRMDGFALCEKLKSNANTNHIPIILLTARHREQSRIEGLKAGADAYIAKPFKIQLLLSHIENLLAMRRKLKKHYSHEIYLQPADIPIESEDQRFIENVCRITEANMDNPHYNVQTLGQEIGLSRVQLYRRVNQLTGQSPTDFIKMMRLKRAAQLLKESKLSVMEIAYQVGFNDPSYFGRCFKKTYTMSPAAFARSEGNASQPAAP